MSATTKTVKTYHVSDFKTGAVTGSFSTLRAARFAAPRLTPRNGAWKIKMTTEVVKVEKKIQGLDLRRCETLCDDGIISVEGSRGCPTAFLARIKGQCEKFGFAREFINAHNDETNKKGWGDKHWAVAKLQGGIYEAKSTWRSLQAHVTYFRVVNGSVTEILSKQDVQRDFLDML